MAKHSDLYTCRTQAQKLTASELSGHIRAISREFALQDLRGDEFLSLLNLAIREGLLVELQQEALSLPHQKLF